MKKRDLAFLMWDKRPKLRDIALSRGIVTKWEFAQTVEESPELSAALDREKSRWDRYKEMKRIITCEYCGVSPLKGTCQGCGAERDFKPARRPKPL